LYGIQDRIAAKGRAHLAKDGVRIACLRTHGETRERREAKLDEKP
jgi:hypothetical protein